MKKIVFASIVALAPALCAAGTLGTSSSESAFDVTLSVPELFIIKRANSEVSGDDIALGAWSGTGDLTGSASFCMHTNASDLGMTIDTTNAPSVGSSAVLVGGTSGNELPYDIEVTDDTGATTYYNAAGNDFTGGAADVATVTGGFDSNFACADHTHSLDVTVLEADLLNQDAESFTDTITVTITTI